MRKFWLLIGIGLLAAGVAFAQQPPPSSYGIGNSSLSPNSDVGGGPSLSPDQNQAMTNAEGSTTGNQYPNPAFAGSSGMQTASSANAEGTAGVSSSTSATAGRRLPHSGTTAASSNVHKKTNHPGHYRAPLYPFSGPSTTAAPGPDTGFKGNKRVPQGGFGQYSGTSSHSSGPGYAGRSADR